MRRGQLCSCSMVISDMMKDFVGTQPPFNVLFLTILVKFFHLTKDCRLISIFVQKAILL